MKIIFLLLFILLSGTGFAQTKAEQAKALYQQAEAALANKQYDVCRDYLIKEYNVLGGRNTDMLYLMSKNLYAGLDAGVYTPNLKNYNKLSIQADNFLKTADKATYPAAKYDEITNIKAHIITQIGLLEKRKALYQSLTQRELAFIKDTIDVYAAAFCKNFNTGLSKHPKINNSAICAEGCPYQLVYEPEKHQIKVYDSKDLKYWHRVDMLTHIVYMDKDNNGKMAFYTDKEYNEKFKQDNVSNTETNNWLNSNLIHFKITNLPNGVDKSWNFDLSSSVVKMKELIGLMDSTGFSDYYNNKFTDVLD